MLVREDSYLGLGKDIQAIVGGLQVFGGILFGRMFIRAAAESANPHKLHSLFLVLGTRCSSRVYVMPCRAALLRVNYRLQILDPRRADTMPSLDWIGKNAVRAHHRTVPYHLLKCDKELSVGDPGSGNLLVQGDNLLALK